MLPKQSRESMPHYMHSIPVSTAINFGMLYHCRSHFAGEATGAREGADARHHKRTIDLLTQIWGSVLNLECKKKKG